MLVVEKYRIMGKNIYNFDKKNFIKRMDIISIQVITYEKLKSGEIRGAI